MNRYLLPVLAGLMSSVISAPLFAWGGQGHRLVADVAATRLTPDVSQQVQQLLALEGHTAMSDVASWADELRERDPALGKRSANWHYVNIADRRKTDEENCHYQQPVHCHERNCVVAAIDDQGARLADRSLPAAQRLEALKFVIHFVGDVHQPMHAGYGHDKGGNDFQIQFNGRGTNLHALWDSGMIRTQQLNDGDYLQRLLGQETPAAELGTSQQWAEQSCRLALVEGVYPAKRRITAAYVDDHLPTAEVQLRAAGEQLGALLNQLLAPPAGGQPSN